jgi:hypothetical protein
MCGAVGDESSIEEATAAMAAPAEKDSSTCRSRGPSFDVTVEQGFRPGQTRSPAPNPKPEGDTAMRFMMLVKADQSTDTDVLPDEKVLDETGTHEPPVVWATFRPVVGLALLLAFLVRFAHWPFLLMD